MALRRRDESYAGPIRRALEPGEWSPPGSGVLNHNGDNLSQSKSKIKLPDEKEWKERAAKIRQLVREAEQNSQLTSDGTHRYRGQGTATSKNGFGTFVGSNYTDSGEWKNNKLNGFGTSLDPQGNWYEGEFKDFEMNGYGRKVFNDGSSYFGEWACSQRDGFGRWEYSDGAVYEGELKAELRHGEGIYVDGNGDIWEGDWRFGKFVDGVVNRRKEQKVEQWRNGKAVAPKKW